MTCFSIIVEYDEHVQFCTMKVAQVLSAACRREDDQYVGGRMGEDVSL